MAIRKQISSNKKTTTKITQEKEKIERTRSILFFSFLCISIIVGIIASITKPPKAEVENLVSVGKSTIAAQNFTRDGIGFIELDGVITSEKEYDIFGNSRPSASQLLAEKFEYYAENMNTKAIVISINSPGGSVVACDEAYNRMKNAIEINEKPVVVVFRDIAASGGYYLAMIGDEIYASEGTLTGSIGVILQSMNFKGLMDEYGVKNYSFTTGSWKDALSPFSDVSLNEEAYFEELVMSMFGNFTNKIIDSRGDRLAPEPGENLFDGRIFSGIMAVENGLVDSIATVDEAMSRAAELGGLEETDKPYIVPYMDKSNIDITTDIFKKIISSEVSIFDLIFRRDVLKNSASVKSTVDINTLKTKYQGIPMFLYPNALIAE